MHKRNNSLNKEAPVFRGYAKLRGEILLESFRKIRELQRSNLSQEDSDNLDSCIQSLCAHEIEYYEEIEPRFNELAEAANKTAFISENAKGEYLEELEKLLFNSNNSLMDIHDELALMHQVHAHS